MTFDLAACSCVGLCPPSGASQQTSSCEKQLSYSWYQNASDSDRKPLAQTTTLKTGPKAESTYDSWDAIMGLRPPSPSLEPRNPAPSLSWASAGVKTAASCDLSPHEKPPSPPLVQSPVDDAADQCEFNVGSSDCSQTSVSSSLVRNSNCRTYRRPSKQGSGRTTDAGAALSADLQKCDVRNKPAGGGGRGRTRDYTVLHPSSMSKCNVTIQGRDMEEFGSEAAPSSGGSSAASGSTTELGEAGWQRKKTEQQNTR